MAKKFTDLLSADALTNDDVIAIVDDQNTSSRKITASNISNYVYSPSVVGTATNTANIITALNGQSNATNNLRAATIFHDGQYRDSTYFLNYNNLQQKPPSVNNISNLANTEQYVSLSQNPGATAYSLEVRNPAGLGGATELAVNSDHIRQGNTNQFYTDTKVDARIDSKFGDLFNQYSNTFDGGNVSDSLFDVKANWIPHPQANSSTSYQIQIDDAEKEIQDSFQPGQTIRVFGGDKESGDVFNSVPAPTVTCDHGQFVTTGSTTTPRLELRYKLAYFDLATGQIGERTRTPLQRFTLNSPPTGANTQTIKNSFNTSNYVEIECAQITGKGILIYRQEGGSGTYSLIAVTGPKDFTSNKWKDYYNFDYVAWAGDNLSDADNFKDPETNAYLPEDATKLVGGRSVIHFPQSLAAETSLDDRKLRGWVDVQISEVTKSPDGLITLTVGTAVDMVTINGSGNTVLPQNVCSVAHNDTVKLQNAITAKANADQRSLNLNAKTYIATHITIPDKFGVTGIPGISKIVKMPFSGYKDTNPDNSLIRAVAGVESAGPTQVSVLGVDFDGNNGNQYLLPDSNGNTFMDFGTLSEGVLIQNCRIKNLVGEGIKASSPTAFKMIGCEISNSAVTDRHEFSPLTIDDGENTIVTGNLVQNFTNFIDASVTKQGVIANNIIKNLTGNIQDGEEETDLGSAVFTYGSTFLISSPNVMMGPSNEFLSSPDIFNSEFDAVNILRSQMQLQHDSGTDYSSDMFVYQENGSNFSLARDNDPNSDGLIKINANLIRKLGASSNSTEEVYGNEVGPGAVDIRNNPFTGGATSLTPDFGLVQGQRYEIKDVGNCDWTRAGATVNMVGEDFEYNGNDLVQIDGSTTPTTGRVSPGYAVGYQDRGTQRLNNVTDVTSGGVVQMDAHNLTVADKVKISIANPNGATNLNAGLYSVTSVNTNDFTLSGAGTATPSQMTAGGVQLHRVVYQDRLQIENIVGDSNIDKTLGEFKFKISNTPHGTLSRILTGGFSESELTTIYDSQIRANEDDTSKIHPPNSYHVGIAWAASYRYNVSAGTIGSNGTFGTYQRLNGDGIDTETGSPRQGKNVSGGTTADPMNANRGYIDFEVQINSPQYLSANKKVRFFGKEGFVMSDYHSDGTLISIADGLAKIRFYRSAGDVYAAGAPTAPVAGNSEGTINIIDDFVMAQGLIK